LLRGKTRFWHWHSLDPIGLVYLKPRKVRIEEALLDELSPLGPFIAIGRPGEFAPRIGARRVYVSDDEWRAEIADWSKRACLIIVIPGLTAGVEWELEHISRNGYLSKTVILLPPSSNAEAARRVPICKPRLVLASPRLILRNCAP
jgi:hypothetical protein